MVKTEFVAFLAQSKGITKKAATEEIERVFSALAEALIAGESVKLTGFGNFEVRTRAARTGRNPQTGEPMEIGETVTVGFKPSKTLRDSL